jgi:hypothetical protein
MSTYLGNPALKDINIKVSWTPQRISELEKCSEDPIYFITKYVNVITLDEGVTEFKLWDFQKEFIKMVHKERFTIATWPRQSGKCLSYDTPVTIRNKKTNEIKTTKIGDFMNTLKTSNTCDDYLGKRI